MWQPAQQPRHVHLERTPKRGVLRLYCRHCDLGLNLRLAGTTLSEYEERTDAFTRAHWHEGERPKPAKRWITLG